MSVFENLFIAFIFLIIIGISFSLVYGLAWFNFSQFDFLNKRVCETAMIPKENCFCEMDWLGNVICSQKVQQNYSTQSYSVTVII